MGNLFQRSPPPHDPEDPPSMGTDDPSSLRTAATVSMKDHLRRWWNQVLLTWAVMFFCFFCMTYDLIYHGTFTTITNVALPVATSAFMLHFNMKTPAPKKQVKAVTSSITPQVAQTPSSLGTPPPLLQASTPPALQVVPLSDEDE